MKKRMFVFFSSLITCSYLAMPICGLCCENYRCLTPSEYTQDCLDEDDLPYSYYYPYSYKYYYPELDANDCE